MLAHAPVFLFLWWLKNIGLVVINIKSFIFSGNKIDKEDEREVPGRVGKNFADANAFDYFLETSALDATNVDTLFHEVATRLTNDMRKSDERW